MISGKKLFIEISNQAVHEDGESVGYFIKNSRMNDLDTLLNATTQPVSDNPSLKAMMRALDTFYAHDDVPETAMLKAFRVLLADVMPVAPGGQDD